eukprot:6473562-Amphidinium_carterae.1
MDRRVEPFALDKRQLTPLHHAAIAGATLAVKVLLDAASPTQANATDCNGWTALHHAAASSRSHARIIEILVNNIDLHVKSRGL